MTKWLGKLTCDVCGRGVLRYQTFYDTKMRGGGWALLCRPCYTLYGVGKLGVGLGQEYSSATLNKITKKEVAKYVGRGV